MTVNKQERYFEGQEVLVDDLGFDQSARIDQDRTRTFDFWTDGVISDTNGLSNMTVSVDSITNTLIDVSQGTGYANGSRINIDTDLGFDPNALFFTTNGICTPRSSGNRAIPLASYGLGTPNYVWAQYQQTTGTGRTAVSLADGTIHYPNEFDGYAIVVTTKNYPGNPLGLTNSIYLATVLGQGIGNPLLGAPNGLTDSQKQFAKIKTTLNTTPVIGNGTVRGSASNAGGQREILQGTVSTPDLRDNAVTSAKIDPAVAGTGLGGGGGVALFVSVDNVTIEEAGGARVKDQGISTAKIADGAVTTIKIADQNVTTGKIADGAVTSVKIADQNVTTAKIADSNVTTVKIADSNVTTAKIADSAVNENKLSTSVAGDGLSGGGGSPLAVNVDSSTIETSADTLRVKDGGITEAKLSSGVVSKLGQNIGIVTRAHLSINNTAFQDVVNVSKQGRLYGAYAFRSGGGGTGTLRLIIDGISQDFIVPLGGATLGVIFNNTLTTNVFSSSTAGLTGTMTELLVFFKTSLHVQIKSNSAGAFETVDCYVQYEVQA